MDKQTEALSGNIVIFDEEGNSSDSGYNVSNVPGFTVDLNKVIPFETLGEAINSTDVSKIFEGAALNIKDDGNGVFYDWDVLPLSSVTLRNNDIIACNGFPSLALKEEIKARTNNTTQKNS